MAQLTFGVNLKKTYWKLRGVGHTEENWCWSPIDPKNSLVCWKLIDIYTLVQIMPGVNLKKIYYKLKGEEQTQEKKRWALSGHIYN